MSWNHRQSRVVSFYDLLMFGFISHAEPIVRWDHPGKNLADKYFSKKLLGEKKRSSP